MCIIFFFSPAFPFPISPPHIASSNLAKRFGGALLVPTEGENDICSLAANTLLVYFEPENVANVSLFLLNKI